MWDSNIFRLSGKDTANTLLGSTKTSTAMHRLAVGLNGDIAISRQRFRMRLDVSKNLYSSFSFLNYVGHNALARWDWKVGQRLNGDLGYTDRKVLAGYSQFQSPIQNIMTQSNPFFDADYSFAPHWHLTGGFSQHNIAYSADTQHTNNVTIDTLKAGLNFISKAGNSLGLETKGVDGSYPNRQVIATSIVDNSYRQGELSAASRWLYSTNTNIEGRIGYVTRTYRQLSIRNFHGFIGQAHINWKTTGATNTHLSAWRRISAYQNLISSYVVTTGVSIAPAWTATSKITLTGLLLYETLRYQGDPGFLLTQQPLRTDTLYTAELKITYHLFRKVTMDASYQWQYRNSNYALNKYRDNMLKADIRVNLM